ncbi:ATP-binding protein [Nocardia transvalensis]|uniref:ATP-binding protein n=1 Tax=Nocardia transvalensis TaxID=37333 RepID=UPI002B4AC206|nr:ATP-binding protein [Nocardia transvalensis]
MTSKVGIVLLLPVLLASTFAVLRIKDELGRIAQLDTAADQARIIRPTLAFGAAADQLAVTAGNRSAQPVLDQASTRFDQALIELQSAMKSARTDPRAVAELTEALAAGRTLRNNLHGGSPTTLAQQADEVASHLGTAITALPTPKDTIIERYYSQMGALATARRQFTQQQLLITGGKIIDNPATLARVLSATGAEQSMINQYASIQPESARKPDVLLGALQIRMAALSQNSDEPITVAGVADSMRTSADAYRDSTDHLAGLIDSGLSGQSIDARTSVLRDVAVVVVTLLVGLALALAVARSLVVPVRRLRRDALQVAHTDLPAELAVVREGGATPEIVPVDVHTTEEIGQLARAVDDMHRQALHLAADQARLRLQIGNMFETLSRRSQSLVEQQLGLIEDLERDEENSERLQSLFRLDHLATRMRRNGDNLLVLAGTALRRGHLPPTPLSDMLWSAVSQVEDYQRVEIGTVPDGIVAGEPAVDIEHLLAELIDNSLRYSPPNTPVAVSVTRAVDGGYLIEITDRGLGMSAEDLRAINERLASGGEVTVETARRMGLFVVGRLAKRHTVTVSLRRASTVSQQPGITASVHLPGSLVSPMPESATGPQPIVSAFSDPMDPAVSRALAAVSDLQNPSPFGLTGAGLPQRRPTTPADDETTGGDSGPDTSVFGPGIPAAPEAAFAFGARTTDEPFAFRAPVSSPEDEQFPDQDSAATADHAFSDQESAASLSDDGFSDRDPAASSANQGFSDQESSAPLANQDFRGRSDAAPANPGVLRWEPADDKRWEPAGDAASGAESEAWQPRSRPADRPLDIWAETKDFPPPRLGSPDNSGAPASQGSDAEGSSSGESPTPIYQRMVSEWLVEPSSSGPAGGWSSPADAGWAAAAEASSPTAAHRTEGGLPIRRPGAQLVPGGLATTSRPGAPDPDEIRTNLSRHLSGVRSGRADAQYNDGGPA